MAKAELKTTATSVDPADYIAALPDVRRRDEAGLIDALYRRVTGCTPQMWGPSIIGYGSYAYTYESGREGVMCRGGFSPRKAALTLYLSGHSAASEGEVAAAFARLGKHETGKACLYIKRLDQVDIAALEELVRLSWQGMNALYPG